MEQHKRVNTFVRQRELSNFARREDNQTNSSDMATHARSTAGPTGHGMGEL